MISTGILSSSDAEEYFQTILLDLSRINQIKHIEFK